MCLICRDFFDTVQRLARVTGGYKLDDMVEPDIDGLPIREIEPDKFLAGTGIDIDGAACPGLDDDLPLAPAGPELRALDDELLIQAVQATVDGLIACLTHDRTGPAGC